MNASEPGVLSLGQLNHQYIQDWVYNGPQQEILWSKKVAKLYYGDVPLYNYWNGCSTGGHQGYALAQTLAGELDGILASAPAMYWTRFQTAQMWGQIAMYDIANEVIAAPKLAAVKNAAIAACDKNDGVADGIIDDPRTCTFNAKANLCGSTPTPNCLTSKEADAVNAMWDGPRNDIGNRIWFPIDRGTDFNFWDGNVPFGLAPVQFGWDLADPAYYNAGVFPTSYPGYWGNVALTSRISAPGTVTTYAAVAQAGSNTVADLTDTFDDLDAFKAGGGKMITFVGANDALIMPRGVINYYRVMAARYAEGPDNAANADPSDRFRGVRKFFRLFHVPGASHCGLGILNHSSLGPWPQNGADFNAVINWVEKDVAPSQVRGSGNTAAPAFIPGSPTTLTRPLCPYPPRCITARALLPTPLTGIAAATWRRTFPSAPRFRGPRASRCRVTTCLLNTSTRSTDRSTIRTAASSRPCAPDQPNIDQNLTSRDGYRTIAISQTKKWQQACAAMRTLVLHLPVRGFLHGGPR